MDLEDSAVAQITYRLNDAKPYLVLNVDITDGKVEFGAAVYTNGNEDVSWVGLTPAEFGELYGLHKDDDVFRVMFHHIDMSGDDFSSHQLCAMLLVLGVPLPDFQIDPS